jgi:hypothetical protein
MLSRTFFSVTQDENQRIKELEGKIADLERIRSIYEAGPEYPKDRTESIERLQKRIES